MTKLKLQDQRNYFKPFHYPWAYDAWLKHEQSHWLHTEVPMLEDVKDWKSNLSIEEKYFLTNIFRFFTQSDIDVAGGYVDNYLPHFPQPEVRMMLTSFAAREALHVAAYSHLIEAMKDKHDFFLDKVSGDAPIPLKIAAISAFTEGLALFSSFIMLLNFPRHGKMKGMGQIVTWSIVDETQHAEGMIKLFRTYVEENRDVWNDKTKSEIYSTATAMVDLEDKFVDLAFQMGKVEGLRDYEVKEYIRYIADRRLISMGMKGIYKVKNNPLPWVETMINAPTHTNFFENRATDYAKGALSGNWSDVWAN
jgi:ribonucleoside-diphosphate reductase beta chain